MAELPTWAQRLKRDAFAFGCIVVEWLLLLLSLDGGLQCATWGLFRLFLLCRRCCSWPNVLSLLLRLLRLL